VDTKLKRKWPQFLVALALAVAIPGPALAQSLEQAARQAAKQYDAKVLSARTIMQGKQPVHEIKLLTKQGVVKTVRIPDRRQQKKSN